MSTKNRIFSSKFTLTEHERKYGINEGEKIILYPVYDSILELDNFDFIIEQDGKIGYAYLNEKAETELILPIYDAIIKKEHGLSLLKREEGIHFWYDLKNHTLYKNLMHIRSFCNFDMFVSDKKCHKDKSPLLKRCGENKYVEIPFDVSIDILYDIPSKDATYFVMIEEVDEAEYEYSFIVVKENGKYTFSVAKKTKEDLYKILPMLMEDIKWNQNILWFSPVLK